MQWGQELDGTIRRPMIPVLYFDDDLVAVDKPSGLPVVPAAGSSPGDCVRARLEAQVGQDLWVVHRLDRDTSGVLVFARTPDAHRRLCGLFESRTVRKAYAAFTAGIPEPEAGRIDLALHAARRGRMRPCAPGEAGLASATAYLVVRAWRHGDATAALVRLHPETGRHHQIRVHLRSTGTPVLFDGIYGRATLAGDWRRGPCRALALHAERLELPTGDNGPPLRIEAPLRTELAALAGWFDAEWSVRAARAAPEARLTSSLP